MKPLAIATVSLFLGAATSWLWTPGLRAEDAGPEAESSTSRAPAPTAPAPDEQVQVETIQRVVRQVVREELQAVETLHADPSCDSEAQERASESHSTDAEEAKAPADPTARFSEARAIVDDALGRGYWDSTDRDAFRAVVGALRADERRRLMQEIITAANRGELTIEMRGRPF